MNKVYTLKELQEHDFDDKEIMEVLTKNEFVKMCIIAMFRFVKSRYSDDMILKIVKEDDWMKKKHWSWKEHDKFTRELAKVYKNIYQYSDGQSLNCAQQFVFKYGFSVKDSISNERKHFKNLLKK